MLENSKSTVVEPSTINATLHEAKSEWADKNNSKKNNKKSRVHEIGHDTVSVFSKQVKTPISPLITAPATPLALKEKRPKKVRDPNAPKRPQTSFFLFCRDHREQVRRENPGISMLELNKVLSQMWHTADKHKYEQENHQLWELYKVEASKYRAKDGESGLVVDNVDNAEMSKEPVEIVTNSQKTKNKKQKAKQTKKETEMVDERHDDGPEFAVLVKDSHVPIIPLDQLPLAAAIIDKDGSGDDAMIKKEKKKKKKNNKDKHQIAEAN